MLSYSQPAKEELFSSFFLRQKLIYGHTWTQQKEIPIFISPKGALRPFPHSASRLNPLLMNKANSKDILYYHTLYPLFMLYEKCSKLTYHLPYNYREKAHCLSSYLLNPDYYYQEDAHNEPEDVYFCSDCMQQSASNNGWAFYKRSWLIQGVQACPEHCTVLSHISQLACSCIKARKNTQWFESLLLGHCKLCKKNIWGKQRLPASQAQIAYAKAIEHTLSKYSVSCPPPKSETSEIRLMKEWKRLEHRRGFQPYSKFVYRLLSNLFSYSCIELCKEENSYLSKGEIKFVSTYIRKISSIEPIPIGSMHVPNKNPNRAKLIKIQSLP